MTTLESTSVLCVATGNAFVEDLKHQLKRCGIGRVLSVLDVGNVLDAMADGTVNIVMIQDDLPRLDAVGLCKKIRTSPESPNIAIPVVLICERESLQRAIDATNAGANEILLQPFNTEKLAQRLASAFYDHREFVQTPNYVGPDRRSLREPRTAEQSRRAEDASKQDENGSAGSSDARANRATSSAGPPDAG